MSTAVSDILVASEGEVLSADLEKVRAALTEYSKVDAGLAELRKIYGSVIYDVKTTAGMDAARIARLSKMTAEDIARWIASELGCSPAMVAARLAEIPRKAWQQIAGRSEQRAEVAA